VNKNVLFIAERGDISDYFEVLFLTGNFQHLTGIEVRSSITANAFYSLAVDDRLTETDIKFTADGTSRMKLDVLPALMKIQYTARMVGNYDGSGNYLLADKIAGTTTAAMGFVKDGLYYYPNASCARNPTRLACATACSRAAQARRVPYGQRFSCFLLVFFVRKVLRLVINGKCHRHRVYYTRIMK